MFDYGMIEEGSHGDALPFSQNGIQPFWKATDTYVGVATRLLRALCDAVGFSPTQRKTALAVCRELLTPWGETMIGSGPRGSSDITDEHFPIEFSLAIEDGVPEVRMLFEAQPATPISQASLWQEGWRLCERLEQSFAGVSIDRLRLVADLFEPTSPQCRYALWHAVSFSAEHAPKFKVYVNPLAQGADRGPAVVCEALTRLGFASALQDVFGNRDGRCEFRFFSLDLSKDPDARVKVYRVHHDATHDEIESWLRVVPGYSTDLVKQFWSTIAGPSSRFCRIPVSTYLSLNSRHERPTSATIHFPVRSYADNDLEVFQRLQEFMAPDEMELYSRALTCFTPRPLAAGIGLQSYVSVRLHDGPRHVTVYLSPEAYQVEAPRRRQALRIAS